MLLPGVLQETYGAMAKTEKIAFILEQVRLCLDRGDYVRSGCHSMWHLVMSACFSSQPTDGEASCAHAVGGDSLSFQCLSMPGGPQPKTLWC